MIILDTNVISELMRPEPSVQVFAWVDAQVRRTLYTTTVVQAEILHGIARLERGKRKSFLAIQAQALFQEEFSDRVLPFTSEAARHFAAFSVARQQRGKSVAHFDAMIAACAMSVSASIATRDVSAFEGSDLTIINPWDVV
jgi:predicted nucleic acid-binding protein